MVNNPLLNPLLLLGVVFERGVARIPLILGSYFNLGVEKRVQKLKV